MQYPEIATAAISGPEPVGDTMKYTFERAIGSKG
jgi:PRTRC genetic system protein C